MSSSKVDMYFDVFLKMLLLLYHIILFFTTTWIPFGRTYNVLEALAAFPLFPYSFGRGE